SDVTGTIVRARAAVVFDAGAPINTTVISNTIDAAAPTSTVSALPGLTTSTNFTVRWSGQDDAAGSGIAFFDVFFSDNGSPFQPLLVDTTQTLVNFAGQFGHTYGFYSVATDNVGLRQATPALAQASIQVSDPFVLYVTSLYQTILTRVPSP